MALTAVGSACGALSDLPGCGALVFTAFVLVVAGLVRLWRSGWWSPGVKWGALAWLVLPGLVVIDPATTGLLDPGAGRTITRVVLEECVRAALLVCLWQRRTPPADPDRVPSPVPRWLVVLFWVLLAAAVVVAVLGAVLYANLSGNLQSAPL